MPKTGLLATIGLLVLLSGCSIQVTPDTNNVVSNQNDTTVTSTPEEENTSETNSETISPNNERDDLEAGDIAKYSGVIKEYKNGGYEDIGYYLETSDGKEVGIKVCDKPLMKFNEQIILSAKAGTPMDVFVAKAERAGYCVYGMVAQIDNHPQTKFTGLIKEYTDGGYGDVGLYISTTNEKEYGIKLCDKRALRIWDQILLLADTDVQVDLYSDAAEGKTLCVSGVGL